VTGIMVTGMIGMPIMMGMIGTTITVMAITGMIGLTAGAMGIAIGMMIAGPGLLTVGVTGRVGIRVTERTPPQDTNIHPTNVSTHATAGIHARIIIMTIRAALMAPWLQPSRALPRPR
jgi:formate hydrogenlyase subunit 3/multisubunit Na+/H+ antiporter MnhD subunit